MSYRARCLARRQSREIVVAWSRQDWEGNTLRGITFFASREFLRREAKREERATRRTRPRRGRPAYPSLAYAAMELGCALAERWSLQEALFPDLRYLTVDRAT